MIRGVRFDSLQAAPLFLLFFCVIAGGSFQSRAEDESGFESLFDGKSLDGWTLVNKKGDGYLARDHLIVCAKGGGGNLFTTKEFADFVFRFEFKLDPGSNNGVGIRAPLEGDAAYKGMEIQVLEDSAPQYASLRPAQYHGSIYDIAAAKRGALKGPGEWNVEEISAIGRRVKVVLNGETIVDYDLNAVTDRETLAKHPGMLRDRGHIGFLGHDDYVEFRNIRVKELARKAGSNAAPEGFHPLFNGTDLTGWKGLLAQPNDNPEKRAQLSADDRAKAQAEADENMRAHWTVADGALVFDGKGRSLCTESWHGDFELLVDWKIGPRGDSGIYLRGTPQVQIWEPNSPGQPNPPVGSGGLYNNQKNPGTPAKSADHPVGEWNTFRILLIGDKTTVFLNGELVVHNVTLENFWNREQPLFPDGQIELQSHSSPLWFRNISIRDLPASAR